MKIVLLFFLLITHGCGLQASWTARHTTMCLDHSSCSNFSTQSACLCDTKYSKINFSAMNSVIIENVGKLMTKSVGSLIALLPESTP